LNDEVEAEWSRVLAHGRVAAVEAGDLFAHFEQWLRHGPVGRRPFARESRVAVYAVYRGTVLMCVAVTGEAMAVVKFAVIERPADDAAARADAVARAQTLRRQEH
jgi:hypothetical protein